MTADERLDAAFGEGFTAEAQAEVQREHAERYVQTRAVIEYADTRMVLTRSNAWDDPDMPGAVKVGRSGRDAVLLQESDWNRVVAVARGHGSDAAQRIIDRVIAGDLAGGVAPKVEPEPLTIVPQAIRDAMDYIADVATGDEGMEPEAFDIIEALRSLVERLASRPDVRDALTEALRGQDLWHGRHATSPAGDATVDAILAHPAMVAALADAAAPSDGGLRESVEALVAEYSDDEAAS